MIDSSIDYYMIMLEYSINCLKEYNNYYDYGCAQHINIDENNLKIDIKERDLAEYLKYIFFNGKYESIDIKKIIITHSNYNYDLVISRLFYPNYYFNMFFDIINESKSDKDLITIISKIDDYNSYLNMIINDVSSLYKIKKYQFDT